MMKDRLAIVEGIRTPMGRAGGVLKTFGAETLGAIAVRELMERSPVLAQDVDEIVFGNVAQPSNAANIARVVGLMSGLPKQVTGVTVHRNCASGMESITTAAAKIFSGESTVIVAGGTESMSNIPLLFSKPMTEFFGNLAKAKTWQQKLKVYLQFRPHFLTPRVGVVEGLTDPVCGLIMGLTAENLAKEFHITREEQDAYALWSHQKTAVAMKAGLFAEEIVPLPLLPEYKSVRYEDELLRGEQSLAALAKLKPYFDRVNGTVTVGNACPLTDGAAAVLVMAESEAKRRGLAPLGYLREYAYAGLDAHRMGLGPVFATAKVFQKSGFSLADMELIEINEAFAAQVIGCERAMASDEFAIRELGLDKAIGVLDRNKLNVNGGSIALGHPVGMTGTRLVITLLKELKRRGLHRGLATLCVGGGQGAALILERD